MRARAGLGVSARIAERLSGALDVSLTEEEMKYLEEPYQPMNISGHN